MIKRAQKHLVITFKESFVPVVLVITALGLVLTYVNFKAVINSDQVVTIEILGDGSVSGMEELEGVVEEDVMEFSAAKYDDPLYLQATQAAENQQWEKAEQIYRNILSQQPSSQAYNDLGVVYFRQGKLNEAYAQYTNAIQTVPVYGSAYLNRGLVNAKRGQYKAAIADYSEVLKHIPHHFQARFNMGIALLRLKDYPKAIEALEVATQQAGGPRKAKALYNLGMAYLNSGSQYRQKAQQAFLDAIRIKPDYVEARLGLVDIALKYNQRDETALQNIDKVLELKPNYPPAYFRVAQIYSGIHDKNSAKAAYLKAIQYNPQYTKARYNLALLYLDEKRWGDARVQFEWIREREPNNAIVHFQLGRAAYGEKNYATALTEYQTAVELKHGQYEKALLNIGIVYKAQDQFDKAIATYKKILDLNPQYPEAWYNLGLAYMKIDNFPQAEQSLLEAASRDKKFAQAWYNLGVLYTKQDENDKAIEAYGKALQIKPGYQKAQLNLAVRYAKVHQYDKAVTLYLAVLDKDPNYASAWLNIGIAYINQNRHDDAQEVLTKALELEPDSVQARRSLAEVFIAKRKIAEAVDLLQEALDRSPENTELRLMLGRAYKFAGKTREARTELEKALKLDPENADVRKELASLS